MNIVDFLLTILASTIGVFLAVFLYDLVLKLQRLKRRKKRRSSK